MANRNAIHILKNTLVPSQTLPWSAYYGEPLVNLGDGIMFFSGGTSGAPTWVPSNANAAYFEVGSNLYDLKIRNQITHYNGLNNLAGKFLSGSTNGFVLADISAIGSITNFTYSNNNLTIFQSNGSSYTATINDFTGLTITGPAYYQQNITPTNPYEIANVGFVTAYTSNFDANDTFVTGGTNNPATNYTNNATIGLKYNRDVPDGTYILPYTNSFTTGATLSGSIVTFYRNDGTPYSINLNSLAPTGATSLDTYVTGFTFSSNTLTILQNQGKAPLTANITTIDLSNVLSAVTFNIGTTGSISATTFYGDGSKLSGINDIYVTGGTNTSATNNTNNASISLRYNNTVPNGTYSLSYTDSFTTGATLNGSTVTFYRNNGIPYSINLNSLSPTGATSLDTYVTGFTYNNANTITLSQNQGKSDISVNISTLASITVNGDATVTGVTTTGNLIVNNPSGTTAIIGQGGLVIGSGGDTSVAGIGDLVVHGNFIVYGSGTTIATNELYIEDPTITLNYNPSGSSTSTSIGSGIVIQDGSGTIGTDTTLRIGQLYLNGNFNPNTEYTSATGNSNRGLFTQLNDIIVRNTNNNAGSPDGKRLLAEDDILDGGTY